VGVIIDKDMLNQGRIVSHGGLISNALVNAAGAFIDVVSGVLTGHPTWSTSASYQHGHVQIGSTGKWHGDQCPAIW